MTGTLIDDLAELIYRLQAGFPTSKASPAERIRQSQRAAFERVTEHLGLTGIAHDLPDVRAAIITTFNSYELLDELNEETQ